MIVLFVSQEFPPDTGWGGIGTYVDLVSQGLVAQGVEVHVMSVVDGQRPSITSLPGVTVHRFPLPRVRGPGRLVPEAWRRLWLPATVARLVSKVGLRPSVIECPEWNAEGLVLALRGTVPLVVRLHSSARQLFPYTRQGNSCFGLDGVLASRLEESSARRAHVVVSTGANFAEVADRLRLDERALHPIPYPVRLSPVGPLAESAPPRVTFVGRLEPRKGPEVVLRAAPKVLAAVPDTRFAFIGRDGIEPGGPSSAAWLRREAERIGVSHAIELLGQLDPSELDHELRRATVCAFPSRWESFGYVVAEASAAGRPVVVSPIAPFRELVEDRVTGRIVPLDDADAWAAALVELLASRQQARAMGEAGAARIARIGAPGRVAELALAAHEHAIERFKRGERAGRR